MSKKKSTKNLMVQGTASSAGKSFLVTALCRILFKDGKDVAPFKSQNMALNSFVTKDNKEMGRAQVVQAEASGLLPNVNMNPILLKPTSDKGSQVILNGEVFANYDAQEYYKLRPKLKNEILKSYNNLSEDHEVILIEGAGSPAEINLNKDDIVNMGLADLVDSPVILIADIDRGGVFASIYGTVELLEEKHRKRIKGFIINKFRGDKELLEPGIKMIEEKINIPCLGVIPYKTFSIDDEDSLTQRFNKAEHSSEFRIGIIKFPHISNISDFTVFDQYEGIEVKYIDSVEELKEKFNLLILPGTKSTIYDYQFLLDNGFIEVLKEKINETFTIGICGGFQMLGKCIKDPKRVESDLGEITTLGFIDMETEILESKYLRQVHGKSYNEHDLTGYFIHMGNSVINEKIQPFLKSGQFSDGFVKDNLIGTYLHGIFDNDSFREDLLHSLGYKYKGKDYLTFKENEYNRLAQFVRENIDIEKVYKIIFDD